MTILLREYLSRSSLIAIILAVILSGCAAPSGYMKRSDIASFRGLTTIDGEQYIPVSEFCERYGLRSNVDSVTGIVEITRGSESFKFMPDSNLALMYDRAQKLSYQLKMKNGQAYIHPYVAGMLIKGSSGQGQAAVYKGGQTIKRIFIDAGHGGKDPGAISGGIKEKDIVLDIALKVRDELLRRGDYEVIMSRARDEFIPLEKRSEMANRNRADIFVSIHANSSKSRNASGFEVYYLSNNTDDTSRAMDAVEHEKKFFGKDKAYSSNATVWDLTLAENREEARELADYICSTSSSGMCIKNRGVKSARFWVLKGTYMPSVLVEVGFVSNRQESRNLNKPEYRKKVASAIADGIIKYKQKFEKTSAFTQGM